MKEAYETFLGFVGLVLMGVTIWVWVDSGFWTALIFFVIWVLILGKIYPSESSSENKTKNTRISSKSDQKTTHRRKPSIPIEKQKGRYHIHYIDSNGDLTERAIDVFGLQIINGRINLHAKCGLRKQQRTFRADRVEEVMDTKTGEIFDDGFGLVETLRRDGMELERIS